MRQQWVDKPPPRVTSSGGRMATYSDPRFDEGAHQPGPDGPLVIGNIPARRVAFVPCRIGRFTWRQRPQTDRRQQSVLDGIDNPSRAFSLNQRKRQPANGQNLIRAEGVVAGAGNMINVDDVRQMTGRFVPKTFEKRAASSLESLAPRGVSLRRNP